MGEYIIDEEIIIFGDFNGVIQSELDRSKNGKKGRGRLPEVFLNLVQNYELVDIWRRDNVREFFFTYYSEAKKAASRIDMIWLTPGLLQRADKSEIMTKSITDHNPIMTRIRGTKRKFNRWRMDERILNDEVFV